MTTAVQRAASVSLPREKPRYAAIGEAVRGHASVRFELPIPVAGRAVYLLEHDAAAHSSPVADVIAGGTADLVDGTGQAVGRVRCSQSGRLVILDIDGAPAEACMVRQQFGKHYGRGEKTPVLAFPGEGRLWATV